MLSSVTKQQNFCDLPLHPSFFSGSAPATFWWTSNELNNSKGVANFKFQVLLSPWHESELTLTLPCLPPSLSPPPSVAPFGMHCLGYNSRLTLIRVPQSVALSAMCDKVAYGSKVAQLIYLYPRDTCYNDNNNCLRSSFAYSITCSCCCSPTRSVVVVIVSVACVVIFRLTTHCVRISILEKNAYIIHILNMYVVIYIAITKITRVGTGN